MTRSTDEWIAAHPDQKIPNRVRLRVFERFGGICQETGRRIGPADQWDCDHKTALCNGGEHRESNLRPVLRAAHRKKTAKDVAQKAKDRRVRSKHLGIKPRTANALPGSKGSKWKRRVDGTVIRRDQ